MRSQLQKTIKNSIIFNNRFSRKRKESVSPIDFVEIKPPSVLSPRYNMPETPPIQYISVVNPHPNNKSPEDFMQLAKNSLSEMDKAALIEKKKFKENDAPKLITLNILLTNIKTHHIQLEKLSKELFFFKKIRKIANKFYNIKTDVIKKFTMPKKTMLLSRLNELIENLDAIIEDNKLLQQNFLSKLKEKLKKYDTLYSQLQTKYHTFFKIKLLDKPIVNLNNSKNYSNKIEAIKKLDLKAFIKFISNELRKQNHLRKFSTRNSRSTQNRITRSRTRSRNRSRNRQNSLSRSINNSRDSSPEAEVPPQENNLNSIYNSYENRNNFIN